MYIYIYYTYIYIYAIRVITTVLMDYTTPTLFSFDTGPSIGELINQNRVMDSVCFFR